VTGKCVECTGDNYAACGKDSHDKTLVCDSLARTCSTTATEKSTGLCGSCISDAQCFEGHLCVQQTFGTPGQNVGHFCFWKKAAMGAGGPANSCSSIQPFVSAKLAQTSIDNTMDDICGLAVTTCPGYLDYRNKDCQSVSTPGTGDDAVCGFLEPNSSSTRDAYCRQVPSDTVFRCTMPCLSPDDCKMPGSTCDTNAVPNVCTL
jgi:hypothetical protein